MEESAKRTALAHAAVAACEPWPVPDMSHFRKKEDAFFQELSRVLNIPNMPYIPKDDDPWFQELRRRLKVPNYDPKVNKHNSCILFVLFIFFDFWIIYLIMFLGGRGA